MRIIFSFFKKNTDLILVFASTFLLAFPYIIDICSGYLNYNIFDLQSFLLWDYSLIKHLVPYKDTPYPYGILQYYKESNLYSLISYYAIAPLNFSLIFYILKKVIKNKHFLYISFAIFSLFVFNITGFVVFARYGIFIAFSLLFSKLLFYQGNNSKKLFFSIGIIMGLIFILVNDQGAYLFLSFVIIFFANDLLRGKINNPFPCLYFSYFKRTVKKFAFLTFGFLVGILPLIIFLTYYNSISQFIYYFKDLRDVAIVTKTPFFNYITTKDNLFTVFIMCFSILYVIYKKVILKKGNSLFTLIQASLIVDILILEQKSIIRSISTQITFVAFILLIVVFYELINLQELSYFTDRFRKIIYLSVIVIILIAFQLTRNSLGSYSIKNISESLGMLANGKCYGNNLKIFLAKNPSYRNAYKYVKTRVGYSGKIFSFPPGDSVFYLLFNQIPPYYNSVWNSSLANSQYEINYIEKNNVEFIFLNTDASIQDGVPNYIRLPLVYKFILNNFYPIYKIDNYLILKKNINMDFFNSKILKNISEYKEDITKIYLNKIPYSEGLYKYTNLKLNGKLLIKTDQVNMLNLFLSNNNLNSENKVIVTVSHSKPANLNTLELTTGEGDQTEVFYNACKKDEKCIVNLANIPLFYKGRIIRKIIPDKNFSGSLEIFEINKRVNLW